MCQENTITVISKREAEILKLNCRVLDEVPDLIAIVGSDCYYYYVNPAYAGVHGLSEDDFIGNHLKDFLGEEVFTSYVLPNLERCFKGDDVRYEEWFDFPKTGVLYMDVRYLPISNTEGNVDRVVVMLRDITHMKEAEKKRNNQEKLHSIIEIVRTYTKEMNTTLFSLNGNIEHLRKNETNPQKLTYIEMTLRDVRKMTEVTERLEETISSIFDSYHCNGKIPHSNSESEM